MSGYDCGVDCPSDVTEEEDAELYGYCSYCENLGTCLDDCDENSADEEEGFECYNVCHETWEDPNNNLYEDVWDAGSDGADTVWDATEDGAEFVGDAVEDGAEAVGDGAEYVGDVTADGLEEAADVIDGDDEDEEGDD